MKLNFLSLMLLLAFFIISCSEDIERENPLDAGNKRTGGAPPGLLVQAGDSQVTLSWPNLGLKGISEYKIYRSYLSTSDFKFITSIPARPIDEVRNYSYVDHGLQNDGQNVYFYRLTYVGDDGIEIPDPNSPLNLPQDWYLAKVIPSLAPPAPDVKVMEDSDLKVRLLWEEYSRSAPDDLAGFKIYSAPKAEQGRPQAPLKLVAQIDDPKVEFYIDGNDYPNNIINFIKDGESKLYKVVAYDKVGVESDSPILEGTSPNLPPSPPAQVKGKFFLGVNTYDVRIEWRRNLEPDIVGYKVYALLPDGSREFKEWKRDPNETVSILQGERYVVVEGNTVPKKYYITAYDNTPKPNGLTDESEPSQIVSAY
ncbi:MAG: fibronectin type III domain-containing protein [bacterium]